MRAYKEGNRNKATTSIPCGYFGSTFSAKCSEVSCDPTSSSPPLSAVGVEHYDAQLPNNRVTAMSGGSIDFATGLARSSNEAGRDGARFQIQSIASTVSSSFQFRPPQTELRNQFGQHSRKCRMCMCLIRRLSGGERKMHRLTITNPIRNEEE